MSKLEAARQSRLQKKLQQAGGTGLTPFTSSFKEAAVTAQFSGRGDSHRSYNKNYATGAASAVSTTSREDQKLGDLLQLHERYHNAERVETGDSSGDARKILGHNDYTNERNAGGRGSVQSQGLQRRSSAEEVFNGL